MLVGPESHCKPFREPQLLAFSIVKVSATASSLITSAPNGPAPSVSLGVSLFETARHAFSRVLTFPELFPRQGTAEGRNANEI